MTPAVATPCPRRACRRQVPVLLPGMPVAGFSFRNKQLARGVWSAPSNGRYAATGREHYDIASRPVLFADSFREALVGIREFLRALFHACQQSARVFQVLLSQSPFACPVVHVSKENMERRVWHAQRRWTRFP